MIYLKLRMALSSAGSVMALTGLILGLDAVKSGFSNTLIVLTTLTVVGIIMYFGSLPDNQILWVNGTAGALVGYGLGKFWVLRSADAVTGVLDVNSYLFVLGAVNMMAIYCYAAYLAPDARFKASETVLSIVKYAIGTLGIMTAALGIAILWLSPVNSQLLTQAVCLLGAAIGLTILFVFRPKKILYIALSIGSGTVIGTFLFLIVTAHRRLFGLTGFDFTLFVLAMLAGFGLFIYPFVTAKLPQLDTEPQQ